MNIELSPEQVSELRQTVEVALTELSSEIADTDNAEFRRGLVGRRQLLSEIHQVLAVA